MFSTFLYSQDLRFRIWGFGFRVEGNPKEYSLNHIRDPTVYFLIRGYWSLWVLNNIPYDMTLQYILYDNSTTMQTLCPMPQTDII